MKKKLLNSFTTAVIWFAVFSTANAGGMLLATIVRDVLKGFGNG